MIGVIIEMAVCSTIISRLSIEVPVVFVIDLLLVVGGGVGKWKYEEWLKQMFESCMEDHNTMVSDEVEGKCQEPQ